MFIAEKSATDKLNGDISIQVPVNMRKYYPTKLFVTSQCIVVLD